MVDTYTFVLKADPLKKIKSHKPIIISLMIQTIDCGYFIRDYAKIKDFCMFFPVVSDELALTDICSGKRTVKNLWLDVDSKVMEYQESFKTLELQLQQHATIHTEITVLRVLSVVDEIGEFSGLGPFPRLIHLATSWRNST
jgi:hypothetical protein